MGQCKHFKICGLLDNADPKNGFCILHSSDPEKDKKAFEKALKAHRDKKGDRFQFFVFPDNADFMKATFTEGADFMKATFPARTGFKWM